MKYKILFLLSTYNFLGFAAYMSQPGTKQDKFLNEHFFHNKLKGVFVDIGAHDGITHNNTYFFEKVLGWNGLCIEPMPKVYEKLKACRKAHCVNCCIATINGKVPFLLVEGPPSMLSGIITNYDPRHLARIKLEVARDGGTCREIELPARTINSLLAEYKISRIDYLSVDTEGSELDILKVFDFDKYYVYAISVENNFADPRFKTLLESKGFRFVKLLGGQDEIYINKKIN